MTDALGSELYVYDAISISRNDHLEFGIVNNVHFNYIGARIFTEKSDYESTIDRPSTCVSKINLEDVDLPWDLVPRMIAYRDSLATSWYKSRCKI
jgi:hypothetical protein